MSFIIDNKFARALSATLNKFAAVYKAGTVRFSTTGNQHHLSVFGDSPMPVADILMPAGDGTDVSVRLKEFAVAVKPLRKTDIAVELLGETLHVNGCELSATSDDSTVSCEPFNTDSEPVTIKADVFADYVSVGANTVSKEKTRPILTKVHVTVNAGGLMMQSTDHYRMSRAAMYDGAPDNDGVLIEPRELKMVAQAFKSLAAFNDELTVWAGSRLVVSNGVMSVSLESHDGAFPATAISRILDTAAYEMDCEVDAGVLMDAIAKVSVSLEGYEPIRLCFSNSDIVVASGKIDMSVKAVSDLRKTTKMIAFNPKYLMSLLKAAKPLSDGKVLIRAKGSVKPVEVMPMRDGDADRTYRALVVPMRFRGENSAEKAKKSEPVKTEPEPKPETPEPDNVQPKPKPKPKPEPVAPTAKFSWQTKPAETVEPEPAETVEQSKQPMSDLGGHTIVEFAREFEAIYTMLHDSDVSPADYGDAVTAFADGEYPMNVLEAFNDYREDYVSSDREAAAFMMALQSRAMQPEPVTAEIHEVPPRTEPHEVVATSSAVMVRKAVIPGGKSVKELSDVFGAYAHKPRGFRDSKGRRVAYVVFDGTGGVVAYRDCYTDVDARLEEQIADYLAAHNLRLAA